MSYNFFRIMNAFLIIGSILMILGIAGSILPAMPGPVLSLVGLVLLYFGKAGSISVFSLLIFALAMALLTAISYAAPILGAKFSGSSKNGLAGAIAGSLIGIIFFPPLGIFIGAFIGAFLGELAGGKEFFQAAKAGVWTIFGSISVIIMQTVFSLFAAVYFFIKLAS